MAISKPKLFVDVRLKPTDFPVARGQLIAVSGNSGASRAPHLHLEFHDTKTWSYLDPLQYLKEYVVDKTRPIAHAFMAYPIEGKGVFADRSKSSLMVLHLLRCRVYLQLGERSDWYMGE